MMKQEDAGCVTRILQLEQFLRASQAQVAHVMEKYQRLAHDHAAVGEVFAREQLDKKEILERAGRDEVKKRQQLQQALEALNQAQLNFIGQQEDTFLVGQSCNRSNSRTMMDIKSPWLLRPGPKSCRRSPRSKSGACSCFVAS